MSRPTEWYGLCDSDPVPGDAQEVSSAGRELTSTAEEIDRQVATLKRLATSDEWQGDAGDKFRDKAKECAENLEKTHKRYAAAGSALTTWGPQLDGHQGDAETIRGKARDLAPSLAAANAPVARAVPTTDAERQQDAQDDAKRAAHAKDLNDQLDGLRKQLDKVTGARDSDANAAAHTIREAIDHDGLKDSWWDSFKDFIGQIAGILKTLATVLSWIATIVCFFCPVLGLILLGVVLLIHLTLAATGNGSWLDVALDVVGIVTFGVGTKLMGAKAAVEGIEGASAATREATGAKAAYEAFSEEGGAAVKGATRTELAEQNSGKIAEYEAQRVDQSVNQQTRGWGTRRLNALNGQMDSQAAEAGSRATATLSQDAGLGRTLLAGDREVASMNQAIAAGRSMPGAAAATNAFAHSTAAARGLVTGAYGLDMTRHAAETYTQITGHTAIPEYKHEIGSQIQESGWEWKPF